MRPFRKRDHEVKKNPTKFFITKIIKIYFNRSVDPNDFLYIRYNFSLKRFEVSFTLLDHWDFLDWSILISADEKVAKKQKYLSNARIMQIFSKLFE